jgi:hypothetical protein
MKAWVEKHAGVHNPQRKDSCGSTVGKIREGRVLLGAGAKDKTSGHIMRPLGLAKAMPPMEGD